MHLLGISSISIASGDKWHSTVCWRGWFRELEPTPWVLKGGYALELRFKAARSTVDIDLTLQQVGDGNIGRVVTRTRLYAGCYRVLLTSLSVTGSST